MVLVVVMILAVGDQLLSLWFLPSPSLPVIDSDFVVITLNHILHVEHRAILSLRLHWLSPPRV
jgi:hypothetical protein